VLLRFVAGEAFQFDWSEDFAVIDGERTKLQIVPQKSDLITAVSGSSRYR
jgi:hypothetical protein